MHLEQPSRTTLGDCPVGVTTILAADDRNAEAAIQRAAQIIRAGGLVAFPTETVYGLGANALSAEAVSGIYRAKRRAMDDPCIVHIADPGDLARVADLGRTLPRAARRAAALAAAFWPGPLSIILPRAAAIPDIVTAGRPTVAVRMPAHPVALGLIRAAGVPIAAPSANLFMHTSPTTAQHVLDDLDGAIDLILDSGSTAVGVESTVLDLSREGIPTVLRPGGLSVERLRAVLGEEIGAPATTGDGPGAAGMAAPGMLEKHYAPRAEMMVLDGPEEAVRSALAQRAAALRAQGTRVGALLSDEDAQALAALPDAPVIARLGPAREPEIMARRLYAGLRELEGQGVRVILARMVGPAGVGQAVADRLRRAAGGRIIRV